MNRLFVVNGFDEATVAAYYECVSKYLGRPEVTAIDVGYIRRGGKATSDIGVRIHVREKVDLIHLEAREAFPDRINGVEVDVLVSRFANHDGSVAGHYVKDPRRWLPRNHLRPGVSIGDDREAGTIGLFVTDEQSGDPCLLSSDHVIASDTFPDNGDPVYQPAKRDDPGRVVAKLLRWDRFTGSAVARVEDGVTFDNRPFGRSQIIAGVREPALGDILEKSGRTTAITRGRVEGVGNTYDGVGNAFFLVPETPNTGNLELTWKGDSGAIWYDPATMKAVGLHVKGEADPNPANEYAVASSLTAVLEELRLQAP